MKYSKTLFNSRACVYYIVHLNPLQMLIPCYLILEELLLEYHQLGSGMKAPFVPVVNKVLGYWLKGITALANKPPTMQIFTHSKFGINRSTGLKVIAKKLFWTKMNFLVITFKPVDRLIPNFECEKICMAGGLFANAVKPLSQ